MLNWACRGAIVMPNINWICFYHQSISKGWVSDAPYYEESSSNPMQNLYFLGSTIKHQKLHSLPNLFQTVQYIYHKSFSTYCVQWRIVLLGKWKHFYISFSMVLPSYCPLFMTKECHKKRKNILSNCTCLTIKAGNKKVTLVLFLPKKCWCSTKILSQQALNKLAENLTNTKAANDFTSQRTKCLNTIIS